jgi:hypothetical protein
VWKLDAAIMKAQPGFLSAQIYSGVESNVIINFANWETAANLAKRLISKKISKVTRRSQSLPTAPGEDGDTESLHAA